MPEIPLSDSPRQPRLLPIGVAVETLAVDRPSAKTLARAEELARRVRAGDREEALSEIARHSARLENKPPALMLVLDALVDGLLPQGDAVSSYAGRLFYCLGLQDRPLDWELSKASRDGLRDSVSLGIRRSFHAGTGETLEEVLRQGLSQGVLVVLWREGARELHSRGLEWLKSNWLEPYAFDYAADEGEVELSPPSEEDLYQALSGYPKLLDDPDEMQLLKVQMVKHYVLPRLLARRWPLLLQAAESLLEREPLFGSSRQDFADTVREARRLRDEAQGV